MESEIEKMIVESNTTLDNNGLSTEGLKICCPMDVNDDSIEEDERVRCTATITSVSIRRVRVVVSLVGRLVLPAVAGVYYAYLRNRDTLLDSVRTQILPALITFLANGLTRSLSSVQGAVTYPTNKIDPILKIIRLKYHKPVPIEESTNVQDESNQVPQKCVTCCVLSEPPSASETKVDVVFIHGLHGSLVKTWKQGQWKMPKLISGSRRSSAVSLTDIPTVNPKGLKRCSSSPFHGPITAKISKDQEGDRRICWCQNECICNSEEVLSFEEEPYSECWPKDWLPKDCPEARVIGITYTTDPYLWRPVWIKGQCRSSMEQRSNEMIEQLIQLGVGERPIVWVGHSKGGLFIKQMLVDVWEKRQDVRMAAMYQNTKAIMFYSVPHRGSALADFTLPLIRKSVELLEIRKDCQKVLDLHDKFLSVLNDEKFTPSIFSFIETSLTFMSFMYLRIVAIESADPGVGETCGVPLDHREICKPRGRDCFLYKQLVDLINQVVEMTTD